MITNYKSFWLQVYITFSLCFSCWFGVIAIGYFNPKPIESGHCFACFVSDLDAINCEN